jgi:hypothetical protein
MIRDGINAELKSTGQGSDVRKSPRHTISALERCMMQKGCVFSYLRLKIRLQTQLPRLVLLRQSVPNA